MNGLTNELTASLCEPFIRDEEYRNSYAQSFMNSYVAAQIKVLREKQEMTQQQLAEKIGTKQAGISRLENVNYSAWKVETLRKLARAFHVRLKISFEEFGTLPDEVEGFSRAGLARRKFEEDPVFSDVPVGRHLGINTQSLAKHLMTWPVVMPTTRAANSRILVALSGYSPAPSHMAGPPVEQQAQIRSDINKRNQLAKAV